ncbi:MAG: transposase [Phycisphaeraceae bacterium]|nr:transposase [Phycisphaeraceae bacterium]
MEHPLRTFDEEDRQHIGDAFANTISDRKYTCYACAVMPDHVHVLIRKHRDLAEEMIHELQRSSRDALRATGWGEHRVWGGGGWNVFQDHPDDVERTIRYIEKNPDGYRLSRQKWGFVTEYDGWPLHVGHSVNSPYVKALKACGRYP